MKDLNDLAKAMALANLTNAGIWKAQGLSGPEFHRDDRGPAARGYPGPGADGDDIVKSERPRPRLVPRVFRPGKVETPRMVKKSRPPALPEAVEQMLNGQHIFEALPNDQEEAGSPKQPRRGTSWSLGTGTRKRFEMRIGNLYHYTRADKVIIHGKARRWGSAGALLIALDGEHLVEWKDLCEGLHESAVVAKSARWHEEQVVKSTRFTGDDLEIGMLVEFLADDGALGQRHTLGQIEDLDSTGPTVRTQAGDIRYPFFSDLLEAGWARQ